MLGGINIRMLVWVLYAAIAVAVVYSYSMQKMLLRLTARLTEKEVDTPEKAKTLEQLGFRRALTRALLGHFVATGSPLARSIVCKEMPVKHEVTDELLFAEKPLKSYYLPQENRTKSFEKHRREQVRLLPIVGLLVALFLVALAATSVIQMLGNWTADVVNGEDSPEIYGTTDSAGSLLDEQEKLNKEEKERLEQEAKEAAKNADENESLATEMDTQSGEDVPAADETQTSDAVSGE